MYWLKEKQYKYITISWGRDDDNPLYFKWLPNGFELTFFGRRLIIEELY